MVSGVGVGEVLSEISDCVEPGEGYWGEGLGWDGEQRLTPRVTVSAEDITCTSRTFTLI